MQQHIGLDIVKYEERSG